MIRPRPISASIQNCRLNPPPHTHSCNQCQQTKKQTFKDLRFGLYTMSDTGIGQIGTAYYPGPIEVKARRA